MILKEKYSFPVHSFVDLITNSSTEIYIEATEKTVKAVKDLINKLLLSAGSAVKCDDLFTVEIDKEGFKDRYEEDYEDYKSDSDEGRSVSLMVKCRDTNNKAGKEAANILSSLSTLFNIGERYN